MLDVERPDFENFPAAARARGLEAVLEPGDVLWLPRFHWHYVHQLDAPSENLSLNFWIGQKGTVSFMEQLRAAPLPTAERVDGAADAARATTTRMTTSEAALKAGEVADEEMLRADPQLAVKVLHTGRMAETAAATLMGGDRERGNHFLAALAAGAESAWRESPSADVRASNACISARRIRGELMAVLGGASAANALIRMMSRHGRLYPGLAPAFIESEVVNSEKGGLTPKKELEKSWFTQAPSGLLS
jgi:hypothetical protein